MSNIGSGLKFNTVCVEPSNRSKNKRFLNHVRVTPLIHVPKEKIYNI